MISTDTSVGASYSNLRTCKKMYGQIVIGSPGKNECPAK